MATITVRNLPDSVVKTLKELAQKNKRSMEQEARDILSAHVMDRKSVVDLIEATWNKHNRTIKLEEADQWIRQGRSWQR